MKAALSGMEQESLLYRLYQSLPIGVAFLSSHGKILSANRQFCKYFPGSAEGPHGLLLCSAVQCRGNEGCGDCLLRSAVRQIMEDSAPLEAAKWSCGNGHGTRWFQVSGIPVADFGEKYAALFFAEITDRVQKESALQKKTELDLSTGALNRYGFLQAFQSILHSGRNRRFALCMTDLDNFKGINDRYGHPAGDKVLRAFAEAARQNIRTGDILGRYGGDEFLFLFQSITPQQAAGIIRRIQKGLRDACRDIIPTPVTFSAGIVSWRREEQLDIRWEDLLRSADRTLYQAKQKGKNRIGTAETKT